MLFRSQIGVRLDPADQLLRQRQRLFRQLAVAAAIGFLLLLPLQLSAGLRLQKATGNAQLQRIVGAEQRLAALRQATASVTSNTELNTKLQELNGPVLGPADLANPLPLLKAQVNAVFDQAQIQINRERNALPTPAPPPQPCRSCCARPSLACCSPRPSRASRGGRLRLHISGGGADENPQDSPPGLPRAAGFHPCGGCRRFVGGGRRGGGLRGFTRATAHADRPGSCSRR